MCIKFKNVTHCLFDMDGLLLDTEVVYEEIVRQIADSFNKSYPRDVRVKMLGSTEQKSAAIAVIELELPITVEEYLKIFTIKCKEMLGNSPLMPGAERLLRHLHANKIPIALATSSGEHMVEIKVTHHRDVFELFHHRVCGSTDPEVKAGKPSPDIFLIAASRFLDKPDPSNCLVFEDAPNGVQAALSAGMQVVMVPDKLVTEEMRKGATQVLRSLEDFRPEDFGLPPFPTIG
ncbi:probable pseudouridine-5'-phosphatase isoform X1 [Bactrocera neohumeralis]|uniref:probable pseudouridine-5'-phosphatase isoform X1 n=1 Tax=Bactrocera tryoni TaxID=59916 RepID=UPI001A9642A9|nr:probable pseudouridine-5'-phosphatase isoform X1 [Bactrocera tryoni]XP_050339015.1 probable pseudouridine-5'-phosphatase isoform X1 [Bactrocera neohumeralis]